MELKYKCWSDISLGKFSEIESIVKSDMSEIDKHTYILTILTESNLKEIEELPIAEYSRLIREMDFINYVPKVEIRDEYVINGKEYVLCTNTQKLTAAQFIDFQELYKDLDNNKHKILALLLVPKGKKYGEGYDVDKVADEIDQHFSIVDANACMLFFSLLYKALTIATLTYSIKQMKKTMRREKNRELKTKMKIAIEKTTESLHLLKNTDGMLW